MKIPYSFQAIFIPQEEGGYTVEIPELPGCVSEGETLEDAKKNIEEAIELYIETLLERDLPLPMRSPEDIKMEVYIEYPLSRKTYVKTSRSYSKRSR
ncbi:type II toxin-antitoxin system HicB family antitoxin [Candidatus Peregrinibacteria bacterium]|nr:type II toxin-antitoxin system HicB family antitoxin [Candidatus Peregrinibacteria bacterium]